MKQMVCSVCSYTYDEEKGIPEAGIAPGTKWEDIPDDWRCPWCGAGKEAFREKEDSGKTQAATPVEKPHTEKQLSPMEMSVICSNLARGCEKQYLQKQSEDFLKLAEFFRSEAEIPDDADTGKILELIEQDLSSGYPYANAMAAEKRDRGAMRACLERKGDADATISSDQV